MFRPELMKTRVLELNASDERGIQVSTANVIVCTLYVDLAEIQMST